MKHLRTAVIPVALAMSVLMSGCVGLPTEKQAVVDMRPAISFKVVDASNAATLDARVAVDGLDSGRVGDFLEGKASLRLLSGNHQVQVVRSGVTILDQRVYIGDGVTRSFLVN